MTVVLPSTTGDMLGAAAPYLNAADDILCLALLVTLAVQGAALIRRRSSLGNRADRAFQAVLVAVVALAPFRVVANATASGWTDPLTIAAAVDVGFATLLLWVVTRHRGGFTFNPPFIVTAELRSEDSRWPKWRTIRFHRDRGPEDAL